MPFFETWFSTYVWIIFQGNINKQGLLEQFERVMCYKRRRIGRRIRPKECMIFVFARSIIIAEEGEIVHDTPQLEYWVGFPVSIFETWHFTFTSANTLALCKSLSHNTLKWSAILGLSFFVQCWWPRESMLQGSGLLSEFRTSLSKVLTLWHCIKVKQCYLRPTIHS